MMHNKQPYSFEKTDVRGRFLLKFSCTNVKLETVSPIAANFWIGVAYRFDFVKIKEFLFSRDGETILTYDQVIKELNNE